MKEFMGLANWYRSKVIRLIHWAMERCRSDPDTSYDDWREINKRYKETVGREYDRNNVTWKEENK